MCGRVCIHHIVNNHLMTAPFDRYYTFQDNHSLYMVQEYVIGGELFRHLRKAGKFSSQTTQFYAAEIILAIE